MRHEVLGFAPDLDPATPGILTACDRLLPTPKGMAAMNTAVDTAFPVLPGVNTAYVAELLDGTKRFFAATPTEIYEASGTSWVDRSRVGDYTGTNKQRFTVFGNQVLATNRSQVIGQAAPGGGFVDIAGAPTALVLTTAAGFVMALNINGMTLGDVPDGWGCCAIRNQADWTPNVATQCAAGRLLDSPGAIRAGAALGSDIVAYKNTSMYLGRYVGPPLVWAWARIPGEIGCSGPESLVTVGTRHFFIGPSDIYVFDGTVPRPIGAPVREWFFADLSNLHRDKIVGTVDLARDLVYWYYPSVNTLAGELNSVLVYNFRMDRWGFASEQIDTPVIYSQGQITYDGLGALYSTYDALPDIAYDSPFWIADQTIPGFFQSGKLKSLTGAPGNSQWTTGVYGDLTEYVFANRLTPRYSIGQPSAFVDHLYQDELGATELLSSTAALSRGRFDLRQSARWHKFSVTQQGTAVLTAIDVDLVADTAE